MIDDSDDIEDDVAMYRMLEQQEQAAEIEQLQQHFIESVDSDDGESDNDDNNDDNSNHGYHIPCKDHKKELTRHVNLLFTEKENICHYSTIKNFNGFLRSQYSKYHDKIPSAIHALMGCSKKRMKIHEMSVYCSKNICKVL